MVASIAGPGCGRDERPTPWLDCFDIGDDRIDAEHRALIETCNVLCGLAARGVPATRAHVVAGELLAAIEVHFASEEALLPRIRFPRIADHVREHDAIRQSVGALLLEGGGNLHIAAATTRIILVEHIIRHDLGFKTFVEEASWV